MGHKAGISVKNNATTGMNKAALLELHCIM
jgi:hypothetical protein